MGFVVLELFIPHSSGRFYTLHSYEPSNYRRVYPVRQAHKIIMIEQVIRITREGRQLLNSATKS